MAQEGDAVADEGSGKTVYRPLRIPKVAFWEGKTIAFTNSGFIQVPSPMGNPPDDCVECFPVRWDVVDGKLLDIMVFGLDRSGRFHDQTIFSVSIRGITPVGKPPIRSENESGLPSTTIAHDAQTVSSVLLETAKFVDLWGNRYEKSTLHYDVALRDSSDLLLVYSINDRISVWHHPIDSESKPIGPLFPESEWNRILTTNWTSNISFQIISTDNAVIILLDESGNLLEIPLSESFENAGEPLISPDLYGGESQPANAFNYIIRSGLDTLLGPPNPAFAPRVIEENVVVKGIVKDAESGEVRLLVPDGDTGALKMRPVQKSATAPLSANIEERLDKAKNFLIEIEAKADQ